MAQRAKVAPPAPVPDELHGEPEQEPVWPEGAVRVLGPKRDHRHPQGPPEPLAHRCPPFPPPVLEGVPLEPARQERLPHTDEPLEALRQREVVLAHPLPELRSKPVRVKKAVEAAPPRSRLRQNLEAARLETEKVAKAKPPEPVRLPASAAKEKAPKMAERDVPERVE